MEVQNMISSRGNTVANQFIIKGEHWEVFQSYDSVIAKRRLDTGAVQLDEHYWNYSPTTSRYLNKFLDRTSAQVKASIKDGEYFLVDLNQ